MYLVITKSNQKMICNTADEVKALNKEDIVEIFALGKIDYDEIVSTSDIRDCIYKILKGKQLEKEEVVEIVQGQLGISKSNILKVIRKMIKEEIIYVEEDFGWLGIDF